MNTVNQKVLEMNIKFNIEKQKKKKLLFSIKSFLIHKNKSNKNLGARGGSMV